MDASLAQLAQLSWGEELAVVRAEGACEHVMGRPASQLVGLPIHEAFGISPTLAKDLHDRSRASDEPAVEFIAAFLEEQPRTLRAVVALRDGLPTASVLNLSAALHGAPPIQIGRLSSSLSHEIRNPLSSVKMAVQTLLARNLNLSDRDKRRLTIANREIRTMERMLWLLSEYGRDSGPNLELLSPKALVEAATSLVEPELSERKVRVEVNEEPDSPRIRVDAGRMRPVLAQMLLNISQGLPENTVLTVKCVKDPRGCRLILEDPSSALPASEKETLFEPFGSRLARGAGLSLAAMHRVMTHLGGSIEAVGGENPPTQFILWFPT